MLVLSRKEAESIRFPELDIQIEVLKIQGNKIRLGVQAPVEISVFRGELESKKSLTKKILVSAEDEHAARNQLNTLSIAIGLANRLIRREMYSQAASTLESALSSLASDSELKDVQPAEVDFGETSCVTSGTCLLVEDVANEREMLAGFLRLHGFDVATARDGLEAVEFLENSNKPDLMLMDMNLPRMHGTEAIRLIRSNPAFDPIQIFAISGNAPKELNFDPEANRIQRWFQKPIQPGQLMASIHEELYLTAT